MENIADALTSSVLELEYCAQLMRRASVELKRLQRIEHEYNSLVRLNSVAERDHGL